MEKFVITHTSHNLKQEMFFQSEKAKKSYFNGAMPRKIAKDKTQEHIREHLRANRDNYKNKIVKVAYYTNENVVNSDEYVENYGDSLTDAMINLLTKDPLTNKGSQSGMYLETLVGKDLHGFAILSFDIPTANKKEAKKDTNKKPKKKKKGVFDDVFNE